MKQQRVVHLINIIIIVFAFIFFPTVLFADWQPFNPGPFSVLLPGSPRKVGGNMIWVATDPKKRAYNVTCKKLGDFSVSPKDYFSQTLEDVAEELHGQLDGQKFFKFQDNEACEYRITTSKHVVMGRLILAKPCLYSLEVASGPKDFDKDSASKFFDSFKIASPSAPALNNPNSSPPSIQPW